MKNFLKALMGMGVISFFAKMINDILVSREDDVHHGG